MRGYWADPVRSAGITAAGWTHTGNLAVRDENGYCNVRGRVRDVIVRGGENIHPREVEEFLCRHPHVLDVAVIGGADYKYGEEVCAVIRLREGASVESQEIIDFCRGQIAHYKVPRYVRFVSEFPMTVTGKVRKYRIRRQIETELGLLRERAA